MYILYYTQTDYDENITDLKLLACSYSYEKLLAELKELESLYQDYQLAYSKWLGDKVAAYNEDCQNFRAFLLNNLDAIIPQNSERTWACYTKEYQKQRKLELVEKIKNHSCLDRFIWTDRLNGPIPEKRLSVIEKQEPQNQGYNPSYLFITEVKELQ